jgi:heptosyltransferase II
MKLALFLPNWVGDAVMATPALRALRQAHREAELVGVMRPVIGDVLAGLDVIDRTILYQKRSQSPSLSGWKLWRRLQAERFDAAVLFPNSLRTAWLAWVSGARRRIGFDRDGRRWLLTDAVPTPQRRVPHPVLEDYLALAARAGGLQATRRLELAVSPQDRQSLRQALVRFPESRQHQPLVTLNTGGAFGGAKNWPKESFAVLGKRLAEELGARVLVLCGPAERDDARWIAAAADHPAVLSLAEMPLSIGLTKAAVEASQLMVTTDSGPRHFAAAFEVPVVSLFGPTHIAWSENFFPRAEHLQLAVDCGPCQQRECPLGHHKCMRSLSVDQVFAAACRLWPHQPARRDAA